MFFEPYHAVSLADHLMDGVQKVLLFGEPGIGKSTLASGLAQILVDRGLSCHGLCADPGSPSFGLPGTVSLGRWQNGSWQVKAFEAMCTLDAGRFRLPLLNAIDKLAKRAPLGFLLVDPPGLVRGIAAAELLSGLIESLQLETVFCLGRISKPLPLLDELSASGIRILPVQAHSLARRPGKKSRARNRTQLWRHYLSVSHEITLDLARLNLIGTPPPIDVPQAWVGRQCAFVEPNRTVSVGEIIALQNGKLCVRLPESAAVTTTLLVRDARNENGLLVSAKPFASSNLQFLPPPDALPYPTADYGSGPRPAVRLRGIFATLINGVFGDPLLHLRLQQQRRSLLFDLGDSARLPTRIAHQITDVFISHAHIDHIGGFLWLLRSRLGQFRCCRLFGPPGLTGHICGMIDGILWDRIGDTGPRFEIGEILGDRLLRTAIQTGKSDRIALPDISIDEGLLVDEPLFRIRTVTLDHGTPVQAYAFENKPHLSVEKKALHTLNLQPGPWLNRLKQLFGDGDHQTFIELSDGSHWRVGELGSRLLNVMPGEKLVYATDLADTEANRSALAALAHKADFLFCEASFREADAEQARRTGHLTTCACGEIALAADVVQLIPFHFSKRYEQCDAAVYREISEVCSRVVIPTNNSSLIS